MIIQRLRQRDPVTAGVVGLLLITVVSLLAFYFDDLPVVGGTTYSADFREAAGLTTDNEVRIAGVKAGKVTKMQLEGDHVRVDFRIDDAWIGDQATASIEIKTLLGQKYLSVDPKGTKELDPDRPIPVERTQSPYDVTQAFGDLGRTSGEVDTDALARSFQTMADTFRGSPAQVGEALRGLSAFSHTISSRDQQLKDLLANASKVSQTLGDRDKEVARLISDGNLLLGEIRARKDAISTLLRSTQQLSTQLRGLVADNQAQLAPTLSTLDKVSGVLDANQRNLSRGLENLAPFARLFANTVGNGRWFDSYICGQIPPMLRAGPASVNDEGCRPPIAGSPQQEGPR